MAEGLNVLGSNVVYNTTRPVNQYLQSAAKLAAQQAAEQKMLQDDLNKVKIDGVRDADRQNYINKYQDWKDTYAKVIGTKDPVKKAELKSQFDKKALELQDFVYDSKNLAKGEQELNKVFLDPAKRDNFTDDAVLKFQKSKTLPKDDPNYIRDLTNFERRVDLSKVDDQFRQIDTDLMSRQQEANPVTGAKVKVGNRMGTNLEYRTTVDPQAQVYNYTLAIKNNRDMKYSAKQQYPELFSTLPEDEAIARVAQDIASKRPLAKVRNQLVMDEADWRQKALFNDALVRARKEIDNRQVGRPEDLVIPFADGKGVAEGIGYVKVPMATKNFAGTKGAIDLSTGKPVDLSTSSNDYQVVGVANFPFINKSVRDNAGNTIPKGSIAQPRFAQGNRDLVSEKPMIHVQLKEGDLVSDYLVPFDRMPENLTKNDKAILSNFRPSSGQTAPKTAPKTISRSELASKAAASGYSTSEYEKLLKQKGIKIK